jgi:hypothetical protein
MSGMRAAVHDGVHRPAGLDAIRAAGSRCRFLEALTHRFHDLNGFVIEGTGFGSLTGLGWCRRQGLATVLIPANVESLAPYPNAWTHRGLTVEQRFAHEARWLRLASAIHTIAIEETWLLELHGISAQHLPYHPSGSHLQALERLRQERRPDPSFGYLLVADFGNPPNQDGARALSQLVSSGVRVPYPIHVVGRNLETVANLFTSRSDHPFVLHGEISDLQLADYQRRCMAQILWHPPTSGMLTRVVDAAVADIPIIGNWMGLKSYHHMFHEPLITAGGFPATPAVRLRPERPIQSENALLRSLDE